MTSDLSDSLATEASRIEEDCLYSARDHFEGRSRRPPLYRVHGLDPESQPRGCSHPISPCGKAVEPMRGPVVPDAGSVWWRLTSSSRWAGTFHPTRLKAEGHEE